MLRPVTFAYICKQCTAPASTTREPQPTDSTLPQLRRDVNMVFATRMKF